MTDEASLLGKGMAFPPHVGPDGSVAWSAGGANVRESIRIILSTNRGERVMLPGFGAGLSRFLFAPIVTATRTAIAEAITEALGRWEPRIKVKSVVVDSDPAAATAVTATISYSLVATGVSETMSIRLELGG